MWRKEILTNIQPSTVWTQVCLSDWTRTSLICSLTNRQTQGQMYFYSTFKNNQSDSQVQEFTIQMNRSNKQGTPQHVEAGCPLELKASDKREVFIHAVNDRRSEQFLFAEAKCSTLQEQPLKTLGRLGLQFGCSDVENHLRGRAPSFRWRDKVDEITYEVPRLLKP